MSILQVNGSRRRILPKQTKKVGQKAASSRSKKKVVKQASSAPRANEISELKKKLSALERLLKKCQEDLKKREEQLKKLSHADSLTGLFSRSIFFELLNRSILRSRRNHEMIGVLYIDIRNFKSINDSHGSEIGDELLRQFSSRLKVKLRESDIIARMGGDEFAVMMERLNNEEDAAILAQKILDAMQPSFVLSKDIEVDTQVCIGIATYPACGNTAELLVKSAEVAVGKIKEEGIAGFLFYSAEVDKSARKLLGLGLDLRIAVEREEFTLYYQPQYDAHTLEPCGIEALLRWFHPEKGIISPQHFIPLAERNGLIVPIGEWVLKNVCKQIFEWQKLGYMNIPVALNLSARQFRQRGLPEIIRKTLKESKLQAKWLSIELTESSLIDNVEECSEMLHYLKEIGLDISIDDFGVGYSSLSYIKSFPLSKLKIDKSFVDDITTNEKDSAIARSIVDLGHNLNLKIVAEGVETEAQYEYLKAIGCDIVQGYFFGRPMPADELQHWVKNQRMDRLLKSTRG